jgi:CHAT domain-containing protein
MKNYTGIILFLISITTSFAKINEALIQQLSKHYRTANYKTGWIVVKEEIRSAEKSKDSSRTLSLAILYSYQACFAKQLSKEAEYTKALTNAQNNFLKAKSGIYYAHAYSAITEALLCDERIGEAIQLQNSVQAELSVCGNSAKKDWDIIQLTNAKISYRFGNYNTLQSELKSISAAIQKSIILKDSVRVRSKMKWVKLPSSEVRARKNRYSESVQLMALTYLSNGFADTCILILSEHEQWVKKELNYQEGALSNVYYLMACAYEQLDNRANALDYVRKASGASLKYYQQHAPIRIEIQELLINSLIASEKFTEADIYNNDLDVKVLGYYGRTGFYYHRNNYIDIEHLLLNHSWKKAEGELVNFSKEKKQFPMTHAFRLKSDRDLFRILVKNNKFGDAEKVMDSLIVLAKLKYGENSPRYHFIVLEKANYLAAFTEQLKEAEKLFEKSITVIQEQIAPSQEDHVYFLNRQAELFLETEQYTNAENCWNSLSKSLAKYPGESSLPYAVTLSHWVSCDIETGNFMKAEERIKKAVAILEKTESEKYKKDLIHCLEASARLSITQGDFMGANQLVIAASKLLRKTEGESVSAGFEELTRLNIYFGKFQKTEEMLNEVIALREKKFGTQHRSLLSPLNQLAYLKIISGAFSEAEELLNRSVLIAKKSYGEKSIKVSETLLLQKQLYTFAGDYDKALVAIETAVEIAIGKFGKDHIRVGIILHELALSRYLSKGTNNKNTFVVSKEESGSEKNRGIQDNDKKKKIEKKNQPKKNIELPFEPEPLLGLSLTNIKKELGDNNPTLAEALESSATYNLNSKNYKRALENIELALYIWNSRLGESNLRSARLLVLKGGALQALGAYPESLKYLEQARTIFKDIFDENHPDFVSTTGKCAQLNYINGNQKTAIELSLLTIEKSLNYIDKIFPGLSERGKTAYWDKIRNDFDFFKTLAVVNAESRPELLERLMDLQIKTKAILLNSSIKVKKRIMSSGDSLLISNYVTWQSQRENLASALSMSAEQRKEAGLDVTALQEEIEALEKKLGASSELFAKNYEQNSYNWQTLKKTLGPSELLIEVVPFRYFDKKFTDTTWYAFLFLDNTKSKINYTVIKDGHLLASRYLRYYRNCVRFEMNDEYSYAKYWAPLQEKIPTTTKTILFDSDGAYNQLNVETFKTPDGTYLLNKYSIELIGTARDVMDGVAWKKANAKKPVNKGNTYVLIGNPQYYSDSYTASRNVAQLKGAEVEVNAISAELTSFNKTTSVWLLNEATETKVKELQYPEVFHISTHGFFMTDVVESDDDLTEKAVQNPLLRSGLLLQKGGQILQEENLYAINKEDGVLTAYEAMNLNFDDTRLVILSACETGLGEVKIGEGVYGLQRSFLVAGAQSIVMSLFKVNDEVTQQLMLEFYKRWQSGESKRLAFANAKKEIMKKYPSPKFWGSFIMVGIN